MPANNDDFQAELPVTLFTLAPWGSDEPGYLEYTLPRRSRSIRAGGYFSLVCWVLFLASVLWNAPGQFLVTSLFSGGTYGVVILATLVASYRPGREKLTQRLAALANLISGFAAIAVTGLQFHDPTLLCLSVTVIVFFVYFVFHITFFLAFLTTLPYFLTTLALLAFGPMVPENHPLAILALMVVGWGLATIGGHNWETQEREGYLLHRRLSRINQGLAVLARTDPLTGLLNRGAFFEVLGQQIFRAQRDEDRFVLAMVDLDHFKAVNDHFGHQAGDRVLAEFARLLELSFRGDDVTARYGGEEFLLLVHLPDLTMARPVLERFREKVAAHRFPGLDQGLTCSIGAALHGPGISREKLIHLADLNLYRAKNEGRNCLRL